jgi:hypothetical protein
MSKVVSTCSICCQTQMASPQGNHCAQIAKEIETQNHATPEKSADNVIGPQKLSKSGHVKVMKQLKN